MIGIVVVSHSHDLAQAAVALASQMNPEGGPAIAVAAGLPDGGLGTDAMAVCDAIEHVSSPDGVLVMVDLGSAILSAELALDLADPDALPEVRITPAPLVEGLVAAVVTAASGASLADVAREAEGGLAGKLAQLAEPDNGDTPDTPGGDAASTATGSGADSANSADTAAWAAHGEFTVVNTHGIHARPAATLVTGLRAFDASVELRNATTGTPWVNAASLVQVSTLGALFGHTVDVRANGTQASEAINSLVTQAKSGFGEGPGDGATPLKAASGATKKISSSAATSTHPTMSSASPGIAVGPICRLSTPILAIPDHEDGDPGSQQARLDTAIDTVRTAMNADQAGPGNVSGSAETSIFEAHALMLDDPELRDRAMAAIATGQGAAAAWADAVRTTEARFAGLDDEYLKARAADIKDIGDEVLRVLLGVEKSSPTGEGILIAGDLAPSQAASLDPGLIHGVILAAGSPSSHAAIITRSRGIPVVTNAGPVVLDLPEGAVIAMDTTGEKPLLDTSPSEKVVSEYQTKAEKRAHSLMRAQKHAHEPAQLAENGPVIAVKANIGSVDEAIAAAEAGADGSGLVRTEFIFADRTEPPTRAEQEDIYREMAKAFAPRRIVIRTHDAGGDKPLEFLDMAAEANPFLGVRGLRLSLEREPIFLDQLAAICAVAKDYPIDIMFPMVSRVGEVLHAKKLLATAAKQAGLSPELYAQNVGVGMMVEVPSAALKAAAFAPHVDFFSVGTNDLTQYALAAERGNPALTALGDGLDPGVLSLIGTLCRGAGKAPVSVCGELAGDPQAVGILVGLGVRSLSVSIPAIATTKQAVRALTLTDAEELATNALTSTDATEVRRLAVN